MAAPQGKAVYKKKEGVIAVSDDHTRVSWVPVAGGTGVTLATANITNLQQTPDSAPKVMLKIFEKLAGTDGDPTVYLFHFNSATDARAEANAIKDLLSRIIAESRANDPSVPKPVSAGPPTTTDSGNGGGASASMSFANTVSSSAKPTASKWFDDNQLKTDIELQQSLMKKDKALHQTYMDAQQAKPASVSDAAFNTQFWATRTALLRAHAIETHQKKGAYNVLSTIKPKTVDGELKLNISLEQVQMILAQHPLVQRLYNENVPRVSEAQFWSRFFLSRLSKKLRGERVQDTERADPLFDRYDETDDNYSSASNLILASHVPHIIDLAANEENQGGFRSGNRRDVEMRPRSNIPIVRTLNSLSEKIMATVAPSDPDPTTSGAADAAAATQAELALRDLRGDAETSRIVLQVRDQSQLFSSNQQQQEQQQAAEEGAVYAQQVPSEVLFDVQADIDTLEGDGAGGIDLHAGLGIDVDSDSGDDGDQEEEEGGRGRRHADHVGSRAARNAAQAQVVRAVSKRRRDLYGHSADEQRPMGLPADVAHKAYMTNATTTEFLKQFWNAFLSGDPDRAQELAYHAEALARSQARIDAVAQEAEQARKAVIEAKKEELRMLHQKTGQRLRWRPDSVGGGAQAVRVLLGPTMGSLEKAQRLYKEALAAEGLSASTEA